MTDQNPFAASDRDRRAIWEILVRRDSDFFLSGNWSLVEGDYLDEGFLGIDAGGNSDASRWTIGFPTLAAYRQAALDSRLNQADFAEDLRTAWFRCQSLQKIDIGGDIGLARKTIKGSIRRTTGPALELSWRSLFFMRRVQAGWKICGFVGYLPL
jgi:hypothetical protein